MQHQGAGERACNRGEAPGARLRRAVGPQQLRAGTGGAGVLLERPPQLQRRAGLQIGVLVEQQRVAPARAPQQLGVVQRLAAAFVERDRLVDRGVFTRGIRGAVA